MTRVNAGVAVMGALLATGPAAAQQGAVITPPGVRVIGPGGPGLQPQVNTSPYAQFPAGGVNPLVGPVMLPALPPAAWAMPRPVPRPAVFAPPQAPRVIPNNPLVFNPGVAVPFPLPLPPGVAAPAPGFAFNPLFVARPGVPSAYYAPPVPSLSGESARAEERPVPSWAGPALSPATGNTQPPEPATSSAAAVETPRSWWRSW